MNSEFNKYISGFINSVTSGIGYRKNNFLIIKHYETLYLSEENINKFISPKSEQHILYFDFKGTEMRNAFEPFLGWIKELYYCCPNLEIDEFLEECNVYSLHKSIFKSYILTGKCNREEEIIYDEIEYEKKIIYSGNGKDV